MSNSTGLSFFQSFTCLKKRFIYQPTKMKEIEKNTYKVSDFNHIVTQEINVNEN